jgi:hypothetical protein
MFNHPKKFLARQIGALLTLGCTIGTVTAGPLVTQWSYSTDAVFVTGATTFGTGNGVTVNTDDELSWGSGTYCSGTVLFGICLGTTVTPDFKSPVANAANNRSALTIGSGPDDTLTDGGPAEGIVNTITDAADLSVLGNYGLGINITHWNNPISAGYATLTGGRIRDTLTLTPQLPDIGTPVSAPELVFDFIFRETPNAAPCLGETAAPCADLFGIVAVPTLDQEFNYDGNKYFVSVLLINESGNASPIGTLNNAECQNMGLGEGCQGFRTAESAATTAQFAFAVSAQPIFDVPTPAPLALMGLGFAVMGLARRAKSNQAG